MADIKIYGKLVNDTPEAIVADAAQVRAYEDQTQKEFNDGTLQDIAELEDRTSDLSHEEYPDFLEVTLDSEGKILEAIKEDGSKYFPNKVQHGEFSTTEIIDSPEFLEVKTDAEGKVLEALTKDGQKYLGKPSNQDEKILSELNLINQEINDTINTRLEQTDSRIDQIEEDVNKNVLTIGLDNLTGDLIATCGADRAAFQSGRVDERTGQIILEFEY